MIQHVTRELPPSKLEASIGFYGILGFERVAEPPGLTGRAIWLQLGRTQIHLMPREDARPQAGHVGVVVERFAETAARLRAAGFEVERRAEHWGSPRAYVRDPADNLVELIAWA